MVLQEIAPGISGKVEFSGFCILHLLERGAGARTRDEFQARGAGRAGPGCPPCVRASCSKGVQKRSKIIKLPLGFPLEVKRLDSIEFWKWDA